MKYPDNINLDGDKFGEKSRDETVIRWKFCRNYPQTRQRHRVLVTFHPITSSGEGLEGRQESRGIAIARTATRDLLNYERCSVWSDLASRVHPSGESD